MNIPDKKILIENLKLNQKKENISSFPMNTKKENSKTNLTNENKKKSKTQEKNDERKNVDKKDSGYTIGHYLIKKTLGKGSFGKVKLGIFLPNKEKVAIKILEKRKIKEKDDLIRIKREFEMLSKFDHPNIILIAEIFETQESFYSVMEYCEGGELFNYIVKKRYLCEEEASFFFYQLINGLEYIHSLGIVHRDLKPENLLLTKNNLLKIIDFGLSNYHNINSDLKLETPCGSPCYASPEMVSGYSYDGYKIDIWACGIILFAMLCGYLPFEDKNNDNLFNKILKCKIKLPNYLSDDSKDLISKILVKNPNKRITIEQIKKHPFYLKGKNIFNSNFEKEKINFDKINNKKIEKTETLDINNLNENKLIKNEEKKNNEEKKDNEENACIENNNENNNKILIIENINSLGEIENNNNNNNDNNNIMTYQPILTDYNKNESKTKERKKGKILNRNKNSKKKNKTKRIQSSGFKSKNNKSTNKPKENCNIIELLKFNFFNRMNEKKSNFQNKKSHKEIQSTSKNFSSSNLGKKLISVLSTKPITYDQAVTFTDTNSKNKESILYHFNKGLNSCNKKEKKDNNSSSHKKQLLTDKGINLNNRQKKINNMIKLNKKKMNRTNILNKNINIIKNANKDHLINNLFDKYIHKIINKKAEKIQKKIKANNKSKDNVIKLTKKSDNDSDNKNVCSHINFNMSNTGLVESDFSSYIIKTEPNQNLCKIPNNNMLLNEIFKNLSTNTNPARKNINQGYQISNKRKNNFQMLKQKSNPTFSDFNEYSYKNNFNNSIKNDLIIKNKKKIIISNNNINNNQRLNFYNLPKKNNMKNIQNNSLTKKNSFFTIRNTMINLNIHTPAVIISSYNKKCLKEKHCKKLNSNLKSSDITNNDNSNISNNKLYNNNENNNKELNTKKEKNISKNLNSKNNKKRIEYKKNNTQSYSNKNKDLQNKLKSIRIGNLIKFNNNRCKNYQDKKNVLKRQLTLNNNSNLGKNDKSKK